MNDGPSTASPSMMAAGTLTLHADPPAPAETRDAEAAWVAACVERARRGDREAFGDLYRRHAGLVHGVLLARLPPAEVPDLAQEVFLLALRKLASLSDAAAFGPWVATLARRAAADHYRAPRWRFGRQREAARETPRGPEPAAAPGLSADGLAVLQALSRLPGAYRETLVLRLVEGMSGAEIAASTGLTEGSVRVNLSRGMKRLRELLEGATS
jgi:RNA polymerase sigma-70 factor (ECF subfamily)